MQLTAVTKPYTQKVTDDKVEFAKLYSSFHYSQTRFVTRAAILMLIIVAKGINLSLYIATPPTLPRL